MYVRCFGLNSIAQRTDVREW